MSGDNTNKTSVATRRSRARLATPPARVMVKAGGSGGPTGFGAEPSTLHPSGSCTRGQRLLLNGQVGFNHHLHQLIEMHFRLPSQQLASLAGITAQIIDFSRADQLGIDLDIFFPVKAGAREGSLHQFLNAMSFAGGDHKVIGLRLLQHEPHGADVVACKTPISPGVKVPHLELVDQPELDPGYVLSNFTRDKL